MSSDETIPTLLHLAYHRFARSLCLHQVKRTPLPAYSFKMGPAYFESLETQIVETLNQSYASILPKLCLDEASRHIHAIVEELTDDLLGHTIANMIVYMTMSKWRDFAVPWWSTCWQRTGETMFLTIFEAIMKESELKGLDTLPEDDLALCLDIWHRAPEDWKLNVFFNLSRTYTRIGKFPKPPHKIFGLPRDLEFLTKLFQDFDLPTRLQLWTQNWIDLMHGTQAMYLEPLMRLCCDSDRSFDEFKGAWLSRHETIENYYCLLIDACLLDELDELIYLYSSDYDKKLELAMRIVRTYFIVNPLPETYDSLYRIAISDTWLKDAIFMPEFEYLRQIDDAKLQSHFGKLMEKAHYDTLPYFLTLCVPEKAISTVEKRYVETLFLKTWVPFSRFHHLQWFNSEAFAKLPQFDEFIERVFGSAYEASDFKKRLVYAPCTLDSLRDVLFSNTETSAIDDFIRLCLSSDREITEWQDMFLRYNIKGLRKGLNRADLRYSSVKVISWCMSSDEKLSKLKSSICIDELFEILAQCNHTRHDTAKFFFDNYMALNEVLNKWYSQLEDRIEYKVAKLRDYPASEFVLDVVLGFWKNKYLESGTDELKREVVEETLQI